MMDLHQTLTKKMLCCNLSKANFCFSARYFSGQVEEEGDWGVSVSDKSQVKLFDLVN